MLEDHAALMACLTQGGGIHRGQVLSVDENPAGARALEQVDAADERRLAGAGEADDAVNRAFGHLQVDILQRLHGTGSAAVGFGDVVQCDH